MPPSYKAKQGGPKTASRAAAGRALSSMARQITTLNRRAKPMSNRGPTAKFASSGYRRAAGATEVRTLDLSFTGAYNAAYTADTQPQQVLNFNTNTASVQCLNLIQQGAGIAQRIGNKVSLKSARIRMNILSTGAFSKGINRGRVMLLYDRNPNGAYAATNSILSASLQSNGIQAGTYTDNLNPNFFDRFVVLMDKFLTLPSIGASVQAGAAPSVADDRQGFIVDEFIRLKDLESVYNTSTNPMTIATINIGALILLTVGDAAPASDAWALTGTVRLRFHEN